MSVGKNHIVSVFVSGASVALDESQRLSVITRKNTEKTREANGGKDLVSECVSVPGFTLENEQILALRDFVQEMVEDNQDSLIRSIVDAGARSVNDEQITFDAIVAHMVAKNSGNGLKRDGVKTWWMNDVENLFRESIAPKLGINLDVPISESQALRLQQQCNSYRDVFAEVAGKGALLDDAKIVKLQKVLSSLELKDVTARKLANKLAAMVAENKRLAEELAKLDEAMVDLDFSGVIEDTPMAPKALEDAPY